MTESGESPTRKRRGAPVSVEVERKLKKLDELLEKVDLRLDEHHELITAKADRKEIGILTSDKVTKNELIDLLPDQEV